MAQCIYPGLLTLKDRLLLDFLPVQGNERELERPHIPWAWAHRVRECCLPPYSFLRTDQRAGAENGQGIDLLQARSKFLDSRFPQMYF